MMWSPMPDKYAVSASTSIPILLEEPAGTKPYHPPPSAAALAKHSNLPPASAARTRPPVPVGGFAGRGIPGGAADGNGVQQMTVEREDDGVIVEEEEEDLDMPDETTGGSRPPPLPPSSSARRPPMYRQG